MNIGRFFIAFWGKTAGVLTLGWEAKDTGERPLLAPSYYIHLGVYRECWQWGYRETCAQDFYLPSFGLGPFFLICWGP